MTLQHQRSTNCADTKYGLTTHRRSGRSAASSQPSGQLLSPNTTQGRIGLRGESPATPISEHVFSPVSSIRTLSDKGCAYCIFQKEIEDSEQVHLHNDSSSTRANLTKSEGWQEPQDGKLRHVKTSFQFVRGHAKMQDIAFRPVKGKENCSDGPTKGYANEQFKEFHKYARMCHGFPDRHSVLQQLKDMPTWEPGEQLA